MKSYFFSFLLIFIITFTASNLKSQICITMDDKTIFAENLFALQNFISEVDDIMENISIHYSGFIVITFDPNTSNETILHRLKEYGITEFELGNDGRQIFIHK